MRIGRRDRRITIQRFTETRNAFNEIEKAWADLHTVWAHVRTQSGKEALSAEQPTASSVVVFNIRHKALTAKDRIVYNNQTYDIQSLNELGRRKELEIITQTRE
jgi:SPP1 family predicted phage head-tail adaptor